MKSHTDVHGYFTARTFVYYTPRLMTRICKTRIRLLVAVALAAFLSAGLAACTKNQEQVNEDAAEEVLKQPAGPGFTWFADESVMWQRFLRTKLEKDPLWDLKPRKPDTGNMVKIPAGQALIGSPELLRERDQALPAQTVHVDAFFIDKTEITNRQYARCVKERQCLPPSPAGHITDWNAPDRPVIMNYMEAKRYCLWAGKRLPTEYEWEKAARGSKGNLYPWGNEDPEPKHANICGDQCVMEWADANWRDGYAFTAPPGSFPAGDSPYGLSDMSGNLKEWVQSVVDLPEGNYVARGSSWYSDKTQLAAVYRQIWHSPIRLDDKGARCAADVKMKK